MVEGQRNTATFGISPVLLNDRSSSNESNSLKRCFPNRLQPETYQLSFNENSKDEFISSINSPLSDKKPNSSQIALELNQLQMKMLQINSKIEQNRIILKEKKQKNDDLKKILELNTLRSTNPTDSSFLEPDCHCKKVCNLL